MLTQFTSFDGNESIRSEFVRPDRYRRLFAEMSGAGPCIARGAGLSYCAASAGFRVRSISTALFNRILAFDDETGRIVVEPGLSVGDLFAFAVRRGWYPPVLPGHPKITIGGCIGFDVHGKNQYQDGTFIDCLEQLVVYHPDHGETPCSRQTRPDLFNLTVGGWGLTGFITQATLRLVRCPGRSVRRTRVPVANLIEAIDVMDKHCNTAHGLYSWHDLNRRGDDFGRGVVYVEHFEPGSLPMGGRFRDLDSAKRDRLRLSVFNRATLPLVNRAYYWLEALRGPSLLDLKTAAFPIHGKEIYYALFGQRGFREYQMLIPRKAWPSAVETIKQLLAQPGVVAALGSLKIFRGRTRLLTFSGSGICVTINAPATTRTLTLFADLDAFVLRVGGVVNLSKDSRLTKAVVRQVFPDYGEFKEGLEAHDPERRFDSALRRRVLG